MTGNAIVFPAFAQFALTFAVLIAMGPARSKSMREKKHAFKDIALGEDIWSTQATKLANNYKNQFEMPVAFYAVCAFALITRNADATMIGLAWGFVAARMVHAFVHIGPNVVPVRGAVFLASVLVVAAMWVLLVLRVAQAD